VPKIDSITALGRLLRDGLLRDVYAAQPAQTIQTLDVAESERIALLNLCPKELEAQAQVLLRKRFEIVSKLIPQTCANLGNHAWPLFAEYARSSWPSGAAAVVMDADQFCRFLVPARQLSVSRSEKNRINFCLGKKKMAVHSATDLLIRNRPRKGIQVFLRRNPSTWSEYVIYFAL
jgi:hypothetical protein